MAANVAASDGFKVKDGTASVISDLSSQVDGPPREEELQQRPSSPGFNIDDRVQRRSLVHRGLGPLTVNGIRHSMLTLTSTALGGGVLAVSYVMHTAGLALGVVMIAIGGLLAFLSTTALMRMSGETGQTTYAGLFSHCAGRIAGPVLDAMLFVYGNGSCVGYMCFLGDFIPSLVSLAGEGVPAWLASRELAIVAAALVIVPMAIQKDIGVLRYVAPVSILALIYVAITVAVKAPALYKQHESLPEYGSIRWVIPSIHITDAFAVCVFAFNCHLNVLPVAGSMVRPTKARIVKVSYRVNTLQGAFYTLIGVTGYISFLVLTPGDIIKPYPANDMAVIVGRVMLSCTMVVCVAINLAPTVRSAMQIRDFWRHRGEPFLGSPPSSPRDIEASPSGTGRRAVAETSCGCRVGLTLVCLAVQAGTAIVVPGVADVLGLLGATVATAMMMAIPAYCMGVVMPKTLKNRAQQAVLYFFSLVSLASVPVKILTWTKVIE